MSRLLPRPVIPLETRDGNTQSLTTRGVNQAPRGARVPTRRRELFGRRDVPGPGGTRRRADSCRVAKEAAGKARFPRGWGDGTGPGPPGGLAAMPAACRADPSWATTQCRWLSPNGPSHGGEMGPSAPAGLSSTRGPDLPPGAGPRSLGGFRACDLPNHRRHGLVSQVPGSGLPGRGPLDGAKEALAVGFHSGKRTVNTRLPPRPELI